MPIRSPENHYLLKGEGFCQLHKVTRGPWTFTFYFLTVAGIVSKTSNKCSFTPMLKQCIEWSQNEQEHYKIKGTLCNYVPNFNPFCSTASHFRDTVHFETQPRVAQWLKRPLGCSRPRFDPRPRHTKDVKNGRCALLSLALGINELGIRLGGSESV